MKKIFNILVILIFAFSLTYGLQEVGASSVPYGWRSDGQQIGEENTVNGTATVTKDGHIVTLTLNNYNGGPLVEECYGTGVNGITFNIVLIGNNTITNTSGYGITLDYNGKINFLGDGHLTINAQTPISYENYTNYMYISPSENIYTNNRNAVSDEETDDNKVDVATDENKAVKSDEIEDKDANVTEKIDYTFIVMCILIGYIVISMIMFSVLFIKINKLKNNL